jgi:23S rRNA (uridine2552-2'-O)-methyltransferase
MAKTKIRSGKTSFGSHISTSAREYLFRQAKDPFVKAARADGYRARSAYKLIELDEKYKLIKPGQAVLDLGAAPGGWCQVARQRTGGKIRLIALDILPMDPLEGVEIITGDMNDEHVVAQVLKAAQGKLHGVISDIAPNTTGNATTDHLRSMGLSELAEQVAYDTLQPGGYFICKLFQGGDEVDMRARLRKRFAKAEFEKPDASRKDSREIYVVATNFKG